MASKQGDLLTEVKPFKDEKRILDLLSKGLSTEFPNPDRIGCPGHGVLEGIASQKMPLSEAEKWLDHLGACSSCFQDFKAIRKRRIGRGSKLGGGLVILLVVLALWFGLRPHNAVGPNQTAMLDLRGYSFERGEQNTSGQAPLQIVRGTKYLVLHLPIGSKEGSYDLALLKDTGAELLHASGVAQIENHVVVLRVEVNVAGVPPGTYVLGLRRPGLEWTRFPIHVL
jgi:hypothetical protein